MFNSFLAFLSKACTFSGFERFLCWKSRNYSQIYLSGITNYWDSILTLYIMWGAFSLFVFFSFFLSCFFLFLLVFSLTDIKDPSDGTGEEIIIFLVFHFHPLTNIHLVHRDFYHLFLLDLFVITRMIADETSSPLWMQLSRSYWHFKVTLWRFEFISSFYYIVNALTIWDLHPYQPTSIYHTYQALTLAITCPLTVSQNV